MMIIVLVALLAAAFAIRLVVSPGLNRGQAQYLSEITQDVEEILTSKTGLLSLPDDVIRGALATLLGVSELVSLSYCCRSVYDAVFSSESLSLWRSLLQRRCTLPVSYSLPNAVKGRALLRAVCSTTTVVSLGVARVWSPDEASPASLVLKRSHCEELLASLNRAERPPNPRTVQVLASSRPQAAALQAHQDALDAVHPRRTGGSEVELGRSCQMRCGCVSGERPCYWSSGRGVGDAGETFLELIPNARASLITAVEITPHRFFAADGAPCYHGHVVVEFERDGSVYWRSSPSRLVLRPAFEAQELQLRSVPPLFVGGVVRVRFETTVGGVALSRVVLRGVELPSIAASGGSGGAALRMRVLRRCAQCRAYVGREAGKPALRCSGCNGRVVYCSRKHAVAHWREGHRNECERRIRTAALDT